MAAAARASFALAAALAASACAPLLDLDRKPAPVAPQVTEDTLRTRARAELAQGIRLYESGDFDNAMKSLAASLDHGLLSKPEQATARKYLAFIYCVSAREALCRAEFRKAFEIHAEFTLTPAEDGHPIWGPVYRDVRTQLIAEREAAKPKPFVPLAKAEQLLADGLAKYDAGEFPEALKLLEDAHKEGLKEKPDQVKALKHAAFCLCLQARYPQCRAKFASIFEVDPAFDLTVAEAGHPSWTRTFAQAKAQAQKALADKAAREKTPKSHAATEKAPVPSAAVPSTKKN